VDVQALYRTRYANSSETKFRRDVWKVLCARVFQKYVPEDGSVLDLAAGSCDFTHAIRAVRRIAIDTNEDLYDYAPKGAEVHVADSSRIPLADSEIDCVFTSNFLEHLPSRDALLATLGECFRVLRPSRRIIVLTPNIRYVHERYWDSLDHQLPLTHVSMTEALCLSGFQVELVIPRFLPYRVNDSPLRSTWLLMAYLRLPFLWHILGKQMLVIAIRPCG
jgi:ubiquinone/menaquinone biosynthesis C-methylase UbiE